MDKKSFFRRVRISPPLHISFTRPGYHLLWNVQIILSMVILGAFLFMLWCWQEAYTITRYTEQERASMNQLHEANRAFRAEMTRKGLTKPGTSISLVNRRVQFINQLYEKRRFSWAQLLHDLADALHSEVSLKTIRVNYKDSRVFLDGMVKNLNDLNKLVENLDGHRMFARAKVGSHVFQEIPGSQSKGKALNTGESKSSLRTVVKFQLSVDYGQGVL